jgi:hypothetical protein
LVRATLLRYFALSHFVRGRGEWAQGEAPAHWQEPVQAALAAQQPVLQALWRSRSGRADEPVDAARLAAELRAPLAAATTAVLRQLYPGAL